MLLYARTLQNMRERAKYAECICNMHFQAYIFSVDNTLQLYYLSPTENGYKIILSYYKILSIFIFKVMEKVIVEQNEIQ